jgi:hypothetical protein
VQGDSKLIIQQLKGNYTCKSPKLKPYYEKAIQLLDDFQSFAQFRLSLEHVYRESNKQADGAFTRLTFTAMVMLLLSDLTVMVHFYALCVLFLANVTQDLQTKQWMHSEAG